MGDRGVVCELICTSRAAVAWPYRPTSQPSSKNLAGTGRWSSSRSFKQYPLLAQVVKTRFCIHTSVMGAYILSLFIV
jgi:hypothetical protein